MSSELKVDTISEKTSAAGVTIDSVLIKDGLVDGKDVSALTSGGLVHISTDTFSTVSNCANACFGTVIFFPLFLYALSGNVLVN